MNLYDNHFSYISDLQKYSRNYECTKCRTVFTRSFNLQRHTPICNVNVRHKFAGGAYHLPPTIFDRLEEEEIQVEEDMKFFPYRATYDFECYFEKIPQNNDQTKLKWENRHELLSVSIASNVPYYETATCFVSQGDPSHLVSQMLEHLHHISTAAYTLLREKYQPLFEELDAIIDCQQQELQHTASDRNNHTKKT